MNFFIFTQPADLHAVMVKFALEKIGHKVRLFFGADQPSKLSHSVWVNVEHMQWQSSDKQKSHSFDSYDVIWHRRIHKPIVPKDNLHPDDFQFSSRENMLFFDGLTILLNPNAWWVNPLFSVKKANAKLYQLQLAKLAGLTIPATLCSNCPEDIRQFINRFHEVGVIYKPLCSSFWFEEKEIKGIYTSKVTLAQLPADDVLKLTPGIFQPLIPKQFELRVTCFGTYCIAIKLNAKHHHEGKIDWRAIPEDKLDMEYYILPEKIQFQINTLMRSLGIVFGCVDLIVTPTGDYVFLEINEQGQFLWIEEHLPEIPMLDCFIQFLLARTFYFEWNAKKKNHHLSDYLSITQTSVIKQLNHHVDVRIKGEVSCA